MPRPEPLNPELLTDEIIAETRGEIEANIVKAHGPVTRWIPQSNAASQIGHPCAHFLWAIRARPLDLPEPWAGLAGIFKLGKEVERSVVRDIEDAGYDITHEQVRFRDEEFDVTGFTDGYLRQRGHAILGDHVPLEIKGVSPNNFRDCGSFASMMKANYYIIRKIPAQVLWYAYMAPEDRPLVAVAVRNKSNRETVVVLERAADWAWIVEEAKERLTAVNECLATEGSAGPAPMAYDPIWCDGCDAKAICPNMEKLRGRGNIRIDISPELDTACGTYLAATTQHKAYDAGKRKVKKYLTGLGFYDKEEHGDGSLLSVVTAQHRATIEHKGGKCYLTVVPLAEDDVESGAIERS